MFKLQVQDDKNDPRSWHDVKGSDGSAQTPAQLPCVVSAVPRSDIGRPRGTIGLFGEYLDDPANRVGTVKTRGRSAQDFDAFDLIEGDGLERGGAHRDRTHTQTVDQHQRLPGIGAAQKHAGGGTRTAIDRDFNARLTLQQLRQALRAAAQDLVGTDHRDIGQQVRDRLRGTRCGDSHW